LEGVGYRHPHAVAALGMALAGFAIVAAQVLLGSAASWDDPLMRALDRHVAVMPTPVSAEGILELGLASGAFVTAGIGAFLAATGRIRHAVFWVASIGGVLVLDPALKALFQRPGIGDSDGYSFPSGTAMLSMAACAALLALARRGPARMIVALLGAGGTLAAGLSVVYLDWHYPSDVLAGWCIAVAWVSALWLSVLARAR
jgi:undecaprenyl-diphosphatase